MLCVSPVRAAQHSTAHLEHLLRLLHALGIHARRHARRHAKAARREGRHCRGRRRCTGGRCTGTCWLLKRRHVIIRLRLCQALLLLLRGLNRRACCGLLGGGGRLLVRGCRLRHLFDDHTCIDEALVGE